MQTEDKGDLQINLKIAKSKILGYVKAENIIKFSLNEEIIELLKRIHELENSNKGKDKEIEFYKMKKGHVSLLYNKYKIMHSISLRLIH